MIDRLAAVGGIDDKAVQLDAYLEGLFAARSGRPHALPAAAERGHGRAEQAAADLLARTLVRFHPSFRFEEALAGRLLARADALGRPVAPSGETRVLSLPRPAESAPEARQPVPARGLPTDPRTRGLLLGGAIASGVSLAGAALLAWRHAHHAAADAQAAGVGGAVLGGPP